MDFPIFFCYNEGNNTESGGNGMKGYRIFRNTEWTGAFGRPTEIAVENLKRDMSQVLTADGPKRCIQLLTDAGIEAEGWRIESEEKSLRIYASEELGWVYALYYISEHFLGVAPMWFWNDQKPLQKECAVIPEGVLHSTPCRVRYRGWFINDFQLLMGWTEHYQSEEYVWARIYETVLRLGGNMMITASYRDLDRVKELLAEYGMYISHTHNEALGAENFSVRWPKLVASYDRYPEKFEELWREAVVRQKDYRLIWAVGYRGQGDCSFWESDPSYDTDAKRGDAIGRVIRRQMEIVREYVKDPVFCTNLYGEMTELYRNGTLVLPEEVIKIWGDSGYGKMVSRRQCNLDPRTDAMPRKGTGKNGMYYHASFHDLQASNHLTMSPNPAEFLARELEECFENGGDDYLIINCGSVKPHIYTLDLMAKLWRDGKADVQAHAAEYAKTYYGAHWQKIGELLPRFAELTPQYGPHSDERGGEQLYHYNARYLVQALMAGRTEKGVQALFWLAGDVPLSEQAAKIEKICESAMERSDAYYKECEALLEELQGTERKLYEESFWVQVELQNSGLHGLYHICRAVQEKIAGYGSRAFVHAWQAGKYYRRGYECMQEMSRGKWKGIYDQDSLTNVEITCITADVLRGWLRICEEGEYYTGWEKEYLMDPDDQRIIGSFNIYKALSDDELAQGMLDKYSQLGGQCKYMVQ